MIQARPYQADMIARINAQWDAGDRDVLAVLPTGGGKTFIFSSVIAQHGMPSAAIAHRQELVSQMSLALARNGVRHRVVGPPSVAAACRAAQLDELKTHYVDPSARVGVCGVDTLVRLPDDDPWLRQVQLAVTDEAHHLVRGNKWGKALEMFPNAKGLGVTATPLRADGKGLGRHADGVFDSLVLGPGMRDLIDAGYLTDYRIFRPPSDIDLSGVTTSASGDYSPEKLRNAVHKSRTIVGDVVTHYLAHAYGKLGMTFAVDIEAAQELCQAYRAMGVTAEVVTGKTPDDQRRRIMRRFAAREVMQLCSVDIFGEGFDCPALEVISFARPTLSYGLYVQQFGRVLRLMKDKPHGLIIDHVNNVKQHGLPDAYRKWSLDRRERRGSNTPTDVIPVTTCPQCMATYERVLDCCPYCAHVRPIPVRSTPEHVDGVLQELDAVTLAQMRAAHDHLRAPPAFPRGATAPIVGKLKRDWRNRMDKLNGVEQAVALWNGWQVHHLGRSATEAQRRFFHRYGADMFSAQSQPELESNIRAELAEHGIIDSTVNNDEETA